jgi:hypothetical protein
MARHLVHRVSWKRLSDGRIIVKPVVAKRGDPIVWKAKGTEKPIALFFPDRNLLGSHQDFVLPGRTKTKNIRAHNDVLTVYPYAIYFEEWHRFGEGSSPIIIVKP